jgi:NADPH-dependent 2,4-dienoyl-CoA reductase/sulfur reductase-like enzyme
VPTPDSAKGKPRCLAEDTPRQLSNYLIVGGGLAAATAADTLRREGATGSVVILSAEDIAPYHRARLSKSYLVGASSADEMLVHPVDSYAVQRIGLRLGVRVARVEGRLEGIETLSGETLPADLVVLASGVVPTTEFLKDSGVTLDGDGFIQAVAMLRTSATGVFAAGARQARAVPTGSPDALRRGRCLQCSYGRSVAGRHVDDEIGDQRPHPLSREPPCAMPHSLASD